MIKEVRATTGTRPHEVNSYDEIYTTNGGNPFRTKNPLTRHHGLRHFSLLTAFGEPEQYIGQNKDC